MRNIDSLKNTSQFKEVYENGKSFANKLLVLYVLKKDGEEKKLGISASKKIGNSVVRHRTVRLIRESFLVVKDKLPKGCCLVIVARPQIAGKKQSDVTEALLHLCRLHKLIKQ
ncbi:MAG: ribonuclease P protein component [Parasporobacterium sp.]|nr:ribonuclease P protein component [Parasporobacterium sp.]